MGPSKAPEIPLFKRFDGHWGHQLIRKITTMLLLVIMFHHTRYKSKENPEKANNTKYSNTIKRHTYKKHSKSPILH